MRFINTDGMSFIGPGSEWFWTALSGLVLAVTFIAIYRQLSLARGADAREQLELYDREWKSERLTRCKLEILLARRDGGDPAKVPQAAALAIAGFWEKSAALVRGGHLDPKLLHSFNGGACPVWWVALAPVLGKLRAESGDPTEWELFEGLAEAMTRMDQRAGVGVVNEAWLAGQLDSRIAGLQDQLRYEQALRAVIVASPDAAPAAFPATVAKAKGGGPNVRSRRVRPAHPSRPGGDKP